MDVFADELGCVTSPQQEIANTLIEVIVQEQRVRGAKKQQSNQGFILANELIHYPSVFISGSKAHKKLRQYVKGKRKKIHRQSQNQHVVRCAITATCISSVV